MLDSIFWKAAVFLVGHDLALSAVKYKALNGSTLVSYATPLEGLRYLLLSLPMYGFSLIGVFSAAFLFSSPVHTFIGMGLCLSGGCYFGRKLVIYEIQLQTKYYDQFMMDRAKSSI